MSRELDALVAEKVMGHTMWEGNIVVPSDTTRSGRDLELTAEYSTDIKAAWEVVEKMREKGYQLDMTVESDGECAAGFFNDHPDEMGSAVSKSTPEAICLAALKALSVEVPA